MTTLQIIYLAVVFLAVFLVAMVILWQLGPHPLRQRLEQISSTGTSASDSNSSTAEWIQHVIKLSSPLAKLSLPAEGWENSALRIRFMNAGYRTSSTPVLFFAAKTILAMVFPGVLILYGGISSSTVNQNVFLFLLILLAAIGYFLPNAVLARKIAYRKREIFESFPDAIDLMTVCVEAGLGLDAAIGRVGDEMRMKSPILADELHLVNLELRAGSTRARALRNLALRTGVEEVDNLVAMLIQADRFGTSVADSLRVHSDSLRTKRRLRAEEKAAKIPVKLLFPLIFCIFPSMLLVLLGPAFISIYRVLLPTLSGQ
ncbi:MAG: type secretion system protein [Proteobacteria bacterium]|nr:type secretion system protein [Pseudomonadota bacterium]